VLGQRNSDEADRRLSPDAPPPRIASLVPSLTEALVALGLGDHLVARTGYCVHPAEVVGRIPKVGGTKTVNVAKLRRLRPTHVVVNIDENRLETVEALRAFVPELVVTHPCDPADNLTLLDQLADAFGAVPGVLEAAARWRQRLAEELSATTPDGRPASQVLVLIWRDPWMTVARDTYISRLLARINWQTLPDHGGGERGAARYPVLEPTDSVWEMADRVLLPSEPYAFGDRDLEEVRERSPQARVMRVDGEALSWYGVRAVEGLRYVRGLAAAP
jgi:ABC-type Fe3+-hydroxamate transport system substrate-binding protein